MMYRRLMLLLGVKPFAKMTIILTRETDTVYCLDLTLAGRKWWATEGDAKAGRKDVIRQVKRGLSHVGARVFEVVTVHE